MYAPVIRSARSRRTYRIGDRRAAFLDEIDAEGGIEYEYLIAVFDSGHDEPFLIVSSERNDARRGGSHFLCYFDHDGHHNLGDSDGWGDAATFEAAALTLLEQMLGRRPEAE